MRALRALVVMALVLAPWVVVTVWAASAGQKVQPGRQPYDAGERSVRRDTGRPVCVRIGTRSEGWAWPSGRFIHWAKCKGVLPKCRVAGAGRKVEGWYAGGALIAPDRCSEPAGKRR